MGNVSVEVTAPDLTVWTENVDCVELVLAATAVKACNNNCGLLDDWAVLVDIYND